MRRWGGARQEGGGAAHLEGVDADRSVRVRQCGGEHLAHALAVGEHQVGDALAEAVEEEQAVGPRRRRLRRLRKWGAGVGRGQ